MRFDDRCWEGRRRDWTNEVHGNVGGIMGRCGVHADSDRPNRSGGAWLRLGKAHVGG